MVLVTIVFSFAAFDSLGDYQLGRDRFDGKESALVASTSSEHLAPITMVFVTIS